MDTTNKEEIVDGSVPVSEDITIDSVPTDWEALAKALLADRKAAGLDPRTGVKTAEWVLAKKAKNREKSRVARASRKANRGSNRGR